MSVQKDCRRSLRALTAWAVMGLSLSVGTLSNETYAAEVSPTVSLAAKAQSQLNASKGRLRKGSQSRKNEKWSPSFPPLFKAPLNPTRAYFVDIAGADPTVFDQMNFSAQAAATRAVQMRQVEAEFKLQPQKSQQALNVGLRLIKLLEEHALYLEYMRSVGGRDSKYADLNHYIKSARSKLVGVIDKIARSFPKNDRMLNLQTTSLVSRLKSGDPTARSAALKFVGSGRSPNQLRVAVVGLLMDFDGGKSSSPFGNLDFAAQNSNSNLVSSASKYYMAELAVAKKQYSQAISLYQESLRDLQQLRRIEGKAGPLMSRVLYRLQQALLNRDKLNLDSEAVQSFQAAGAQEVARFYIEQVALNNIKSQPSRAAKLYAEVQSVGDYSKSFNAYLELRVLDIYLNARDLIMTQTQWQRVGQLNDVLGQVVTGRVFYTQELALAQAQAKLDGENIARFVSLHDFFVKNYTDYAAREDWVIKVIDILAKARRSADVAARADALIASTRDKATLLTALRYSMRARESLLGLTVEPKLIPKKRLAADEQVAQAYIVTLDKMASSAVGKEAEQAFFQAAYVTHLLGQDNPARQRFEAAISKFSKGNSAKESVSYLLNDAQAAKDWVYTEKVARLALKLGISPSSSEHKNLRVILENAVYSHAQQLSAQGKFEPAAQRYVAFQKEFRNHKNAATALDLASKNFLKAKKTDAAVTQMESLIKNYPTSGYVKETIWQAAELSKGIAQFLRAANHYERFATQYAQDGKKRNAWLSSAEMHKSLGRFANAVAHYEKHLNQLSSSPEKLKVAREIADIHFKYGRSAEAIAAYERMMKFVSNSDDELYLRSQILAIQTRQGLDSEAKKTVARMISLKPSGQEGYKNQAKAKYNLARMESPTLRERDVQNRRDLGPAVRSLGVDYDRVKGLFLAACEVPGLEYCSSGYYETARLAEEISKNLLELELPPTLNPAEVNGIRTSITQTAERLQADAKSFAAQAEQALSNGAPDAETAERIRSYAQQMRGESDDSVTLE